MKNALCEGPRSSEQIKQSDVLGKEIHIMMAYSTLDGNKEYILLIHTLLWPSNFRIISSCNSRIMTDNGKGFLHSIKERLF